MKKISLAILFTIVSIGIQAQTKWGFRLAPNLTYTHQTGKYPFLIDGKAIGLSIGPVADFYLTKHIAFSTGLWYTVKSIAPKTNLSSAGIFTSDGRNIVYADPVYGYYVHYLQLPATIKFFIGSPDAQWRFYIQPGATFDLKFAESPRGKDHNILYQISQQTNDGKKVFKSTDIDAYLGMGIEWKWKWNDKTFFTGIAYNRSFSGQVNQLDYVRNRQELGFDQQVGLYILETGIKF